MKWMDMLTDVESNDLFEQMPFPIGCIRMASLQNGYGNVQLGDCVYQMTFHIQYMRWGQPRDYEQLILTQALIQSLRMS